MKYRIRLSQIEWDDGKGEYDVSQLPTTIVLDVIANSDQAAVEHAMSDASDEIGSLIAGCKATIHSRRLR